VESQIEGIIRRVEKDTPITSIWNRLESFMSTNEEYFKSLPSLEEYLMRSELNPCEERATQVLSRR
jgi:hypothetical protein